MAAPTYVATTEANSPTDWTTENELETRTTPSYSPAAGTILVGAAAAESESKAISSISGGATWTQQYLDNTPSHCSAALYTATAAGGSITSAVTASNNIYNCKLGLAVLQFTGSDGIGNKATAKAASVTLTTTQGNSAIVAIVADWSAVTGTSTWAAISGSNAVEVVDYSDGVKYGVHIAYWPDVGAAGDKTVQMTAPSGMTPTLLAIEVKGSTSGDVSVSVTGLSATASTKTPTFSGIINRVDYIGASTPAEANNADITFTEPAGVQEGDLLIAAIAHRSTIGYQKPANWTSKLLDQSSGNTSTTVTSSIASGELFYVVRGASAPTLTFTKEAGTGDVARGTIIAVRGQDTTTPIRASLQTTLAANSNTVVTTGTISPQAGDLVLGVWCGADNITWSAEQINGTPTALIEVIDAGSNTGADNSIGVAYLTITQESISNQTVQATASGTNSRHVVLALDIAPMVSSVPVTVTLGAGFSATATVVAPSVAVHQSFTAGNLAATATAGSISTINAAANYTPTGRSATATVGSPTETAAANYTLTGRSATATVVAPTVSVSNSISVPVTGLSATATVQVPSVTMSANATPTGVAATATVQVPSVQVGVLTWSAYAGATGYRIYWGTTSAYYTTGPISIGNVLSYSLTSLGLPANTTCYIKVRAWNGTSEIGDAAPEFVVLNGVIETNPYLVLLVSGLGATATRGTLSFTMSANAAPIGILATATAGTVTAIGTASIAVNLTGFGLTATRGDVAAAVYTFVSATGLSATATLNAPTVTAPVSVPVNGFSLTATRGIPAAFGGSLVWDASPEAISYRIYWGTTSGVYTQSLDVGNVLSYSVALLGLARETTYYSIVRAWDGSLESSNSSEIILLNGGQLPTPYTLATIPGRVLTATLGTPAPRADITAAPVGRAASATLGIVSVQTSGNITLTPASFALTSTPGTPTITAPVTVAATTQGATLTRGSVVVIAQTFQSVVVSLIGLGSASARGNTVVTAAANATSGAPLTTASIGPPLASVSTAPVIVTPAGLTATRSSPAVTGTANVTPLGVAGSVQIGVPTVSGASRVAITGNASVAALNYLDIDVDSTVDYPALGVGLASTLGNLTVTIQGAVSFGITGVVFVAIPGIPQCVGTAFVPSGNFSAVTSLNSPAVTNTPNVSVAGRLATATVGPVAVSTNAGEVIANIGGLGMTLTMVSPLPSADSVIDLPAGFYIVSASNFNLDFRYGVDVYADSFALTSAVGNFGLSADVATGISGFALNVHAGHPSVVQNVDIDAVPLSAMAVHLGNVKVRTRNPHSHWVNVMVRSSRSIFRSGRMW